MVSLWENWRQGRRGRSPFDTAGGMETHAVELTRRSSSVSLTRQGADRGNLRINLSWRMRSSDLEVRRSLGDSLRGLANAFKPVELEGHTRGVVSVDLDLACMYEMADGSKGVVQALGGFLGDLNSPPYVRLSGDDRFGGASGETIYVNLDHKDEIKRLLVFVYIYDNTPAFDRAHALVSLIPSSGPRVEVSLEERAPRARSCAVLLIEHEKGQLVARREVRYVFGFQSELDRLYGWGLQWGRGYKAGRS